MWLRDSQSNKQLYIYKHYIIRYYMRTHLFICIYTNKKRRRRRRGDAPPPPPSIDYTSQPPSDDRGTEANNRNLRLYGEAVRYWRITLPLLLLASPGT